MDDSSAADHHHTAELGTGPVADWLSWLDRAARATVNPGILRLIEDVGRELRELGPIDTEMVAVVHGALESVAAALDTDRLLHRLN